MKVAGFNKNLGIVSFIIIAIALFIGLQLINRVFLSANKSNRNSEMVESVFIGPGKYAENFEKSLQRAGEFYDRYREARVHMQSKDYERAISLYNESLSFAKIGIEKGMAYKKLAEIYREQGDLEKELFYVEQWPRYSMNKQINEEANRRAAEIRQLLAESATQKADSRLTDGGQASSGGKNQANE